MRWGDQSGKVSWDVAVLVVFLGSLAYFSWKYVPLWIEFMEVRRQAGLAAQRASLYDDVDDARAWFDNLQVEAGRADWMMAHYLTWTPKPDRQWNVHLFYQVDVVHPFMDRPHTVDFEWSCTTSNRGCKSP